MEDELEYGNIRGKEDMWVFTVVQMKERDGEKWNVSEFYIVFNKVLQYRSS